MYSLDYTSKNVYEYALTTAWDVTTATLLKSFSISATVTDPSNIFFKPDGTSMYITDYAAAKVFHYNLSTPWDIATVYNSFSLSVSPQDGGPKGLSFKPDGTKMYITGLVNKKVYEYNLSTPWWVNSATFANQFLVSTQEANPVGLFFKPDGTKMYVLGNVTGQKVYEYNLSTPWSVATASYLQSFSVSAQEATPFSTYFKFDGLKMYMVGLNAQKVFEYSLSGDVGGDGYLELTYTATNPTPQNGTDGWISLASTNGGTGTYGVTVGTNSLGGYAWGSEVMGWIDFSAISFTPPCSIANVCSTDHTQSINTDAWCTVATTTCSAGYICKDAGGLCGAGDPSGTMTFSNQKVKKGKTVSISWNVLYASTCVVSGTNGDSWTPASSSAQISQAIQNEATYTLSCQPVGGGTPVLLDTKKVTLIPSIREF
jgi:hypothetical protein